ncbi:MAG TPA: hypothetical protein VG796_29885 [Verrucomicrobiales bacterium]|nr:hypothetical protein [Verrucomicrobiales bacterium]
MRGGTSPEAEGVTFDLSTDGGGSWLPLGAAVRILGGWEAAQVDLSPSGRIRARARIAGGMGNTSSFTH